MFQRKVVMMGRDKEQSSVNQKVSSLLSAVSAVSSPHIINVIWFHWEIPEDEFYFIS